MTALRHMYVFCIRFGFGFEFWIWNRCQSFDGFPFFSSSSSLLQCTTICLINIHATAGSNVKDATSSSFSLSLFLPFRLPFPFLFPFLGLLLFFLLDFISVKSFQLSRSHHRYCNRNRIRSGKRKTQTHLSLVDITYTQCVWPQRIYCCAALRSAAVFKAWGGRHYKGWPCILKRLIDFVCVCVWLFGRPSGNGDSEGGFCFKWSVTNGH